MSEITDEELKRLGIERDIAEFRLGVAREAALEATMRVKVTEQELAAIKSKLKDLK